MDDMLDLELTMELESLRRELDSLKKENCKMKKVIIDNGLEEEVDNFSSVTPEEQICIDGIKHLVEVFKNGTFDKNDALNFDILHKNLRMIKGQAVPSSGKKKDKVVDIKELLRIVEGDK